jgi:hypothetical protein
MPCPSWIPDDRPVRTADGSTPDTLTPCGANSRRAVCLGIGLGIQRALDPSISAQLITDGMRMLLMLAGATFQTAMPGSS